MESLNGEVCPASGTYVWSGDEVVTCRDCGQQVKRYSNGNIYKHTRPIEQPKEETTWAPKYEVGQRISWTVHYLDGDTIHTGTVIGYGERRGYYRVMMDADTTRGLRQQVHIVSTGRIVK
jgi:hypothetical protein